MSGTPAARCRAVPAEPALPPDYEAQTRLLARAYMLRDMAENEQIQGNWGDAVAHLSQAAEICRQYYHLEQPGAESQIFMELGCAAEAAGQNDLALKSYRQCIVSNPHMLEARLKLATLLCRLGDIDTAIAETRRAVALDVDDPRPHYLLALLLECRGDLLAAGAERAKARAQLHAGPRLKPDESRHSDSSQGKGAERQTGDIKPADTPEDMPLGLP